MRLTVRNNYIHSRSISFSLHTCVCKNMLDLADTVPQMICLGCPYGGREFDKFRDKGLLKSLYNVYS